MIDVDESPSDVVWSDDHDAYVTRFDGDSTSVVVAEILEEVLDDWSTPLFDYVDPDALDLLVRSSNTITVTFEVEESTVTVHGDGRVFVRV